MENTTDPLIAEIEAEIEADNAVWESLQGSFKDWALGDLKDVAGSTSPHLSEEGQRVQARHRQLREALPLRAKAQELLDALNERDLASKVTRFESLFFSFGWAGVQIGGRYYASEPRIEATIKTFGYEAEVWPPSAEAQAVLDEAAEALGLSWKWEPCEKGWGSAVFRLKGSAN